MYEKISNELARYDKVLKLKKKILKEIETELRRIKTEMSVNSSDDDFNYCVKQSFSLLGLKQYLEAGDCFMRYAARYEDSEVIVYLVSVKDLNIWLQEDYSFVTNFLLAAKEHKYNVFPLLNDRYFGGSFTNVIDIVLYDEKQKNVKSEEQAFK